MKEMNAQNRFLPYSSLRELQPGDVIRGEANTHGMFVNAVLIGTPTVKYTGDERGQLVYWRWNTTRPWAAGLFDTLGFIGAPIKSHRYTPFDQDPMTSWELLMHAARDLLNETGSLRELVDQKKVLTAIELLIYDEPVGLKTISEVGSRADVNRRLYGQTAEQ